MISQRDLLGLLIKQAKNMHIRSVDVNFPNYYSESFSGDYGTHPKVKISGVICELINNYKKALRKANREYKILKGKRRSASAWRWVYIDFAWEKACNILKIETRKKAEKDISLILNRKPLVWMGEKPCNGYGGLLKLS